MYRSMKIYYKDGRLRACPYCNKKRRAGYLGACPEHLYLLELKRKVEGLKTYCYNRGVTLTYRMDSKSIILNVQSMATVGIMYTASESISYDDLNQSVVPMEEILVDTVGGMLGCSEGATCKEA